MSDPQFRRRWISFGEVIALGALVISALGLWITWKSNQNGKPTEVVEHKQAIPLILRGSVQGDGRELIISPVESSHALESLTVTVPGNSAIEVGSDGRLSASDVEGALKADKEQKGSHAVRATIAARYVEMGKERRSSGTYSIRYRWEGGGL